jgi:hypothetical protein
VSLDGYDDHVCGAPGCSACDVFKRVGETEDQWQARLRAMWNAPEARPLTGPKTDDPNCRRGHPWAESAATNTAGDRYCRQCAIERKRELRRLERERRQEAVA